MKIFEECDRNFSIKILKSMIAFHAALVNQKYIAHENDGGVGDQGIEITALNPLGQFQVLFGHFEKDLDTPAFAVDTHDVLIGQLSVV